jgi:hypothetical protein
MASHRCLVRDEVIGSGPPGEASPDRPRSNSPWSAASYCGGRGLERLQFLLVMRRAKGYSIHRDPARREDHTIWTATAPEASESDQ